MKAIALLLSLGLARVAAPAAVPALELSFAEAVVLAEKRAGVIELERSAVRRSTLALSESRLRLGPELSFKSAAGYLTNPPEGITVSAGELGQIILDPGPPPVSFPIPSRDITFLEEARHGYFELELELSQPLYTWGKLRSSVDLAALDLEISRSGLELGRRKLYQDVHRAYFSALLARESALLLESCLDIMEEIQADRKRSFDLGLINRQSLLEVESRKAAIRKGLVRAEQSCSSWLEALAFYTELEPPELNLSGSFRAPPAPLDEEELKRRAEDSSPLLRRLLLQEEQARSNLALARGAALLRPDLALNLVFGLSGQTLPGSETGWQDSWRANLMVGLGARGTLFDSGRSGRRIAQAKEALAAAREAVAVQRRQVRLQVRQAVQEVEVGRAEVEEKLALKAEAEEAEKNSAEAFAQQLITREQWGSARIRLLERRLALLAAEQGLEQALASLEALTGFGWPGGPSLPIN